MRDAGLLLCAAIGLLVGEVVCSIARGITSLVEWMEGW